ncbi:RagB/SusD family nutrient uptake outer membrane protein [Sphingobacterium wenxiniae]|uniref:Starch-binding associating with outer membrane n=1 Tax=Sphingobacterium wenxiniae TaxID=683125 RepID=A0A1I6TXS2_9SPHI|nr:RagB/SusD family nutrient uptake outer membrane protein [Sphingobacterium wenxiniae]SFS93960.1 Starch-binding associating with outer membrane [Sphingobacterium wenxiniae]
MKFNKLYILLFAGALCTGTSCTKFDVDMHSAYTDDTFPKTPDQFVAVTGPVYTSARGYFGDYFDLQTAGSDEVVIPTRGGDWFDGGKWRDMHFHSWSPSHEVVRNAWNWGFNAIGTCNQVLGILENAEDSDQKNQTLAEIKTMRAWYYYLMMDTYGNVPLVTTFDTGNELPSTTPRAQVYEFVVTELEANLALLSEEKSEATYGRPTKWFAHALLAKAYLNAQVYTGTANWNKVVEHADAVIASGKYNLENDFLAQFMPDNGAQSPEPIFSIPFDPARAEGNQLFNKVLHYAHRQTFDLSVNPWNGWSAQPAYFDLFDDADNRTQQWLAGQQYNSTGQPLIYNGMNIVIDPYGYNLLPGSDFDIGGADEGGRLAGARCVKYFPDKNQANNNAGNDVIVFRLADVLLMKAEAILRGATNGTRDQALEAANLVRKRAFPINPEKHFTASSLTLDAIYKERALEFTFEVTRRTDMIRFGKWEDAMLFKPANSGEAYKRLFPIPATALANNTNLTPNPGY